jgi:hypothetical protein
VSLSTANTADIHVVDPEGMAHAIPVDIVKLGLGICEEHQDPFDPSYVPSAAAMAQAYIAMAYALRHEPPRSIAKS